MRGLRLASLIVGAGCLLGGGEACAMDAVAPAGASVAAVAQAPSPAPPLASAPQASSAPVYEPPMRGAPASRISGATRGAGAAGALVLVLAPEATGLTLEAAPTLYWYLSEPAGISVEITVTEDNVPSPIVEARLPLPAKSGIQAFSLAVHRASLRPGIEYQWSVALVIDPSDRSRDIVASARIRRTEETPELEARLAAAAPRERPAILAAASIWYDAIAELSSTAGRDPRASEGRAALLRQVGLADAAQ